MCWILKESVSFYFYDFLLIIWYNKFYSLILGRPPSGGPFCLMQGSDEHVVTFNALEIDRAFKNEKIHSGFKVNSFFRLLK